MYIRMEEKMGDLKKNTRTLKRDEEETFMITKEEEQTVKRLQKYIQKFYEKQIEKQEQKGEEEKENGQIQDIQKRDNGTPI